MLKCYLGSLNSTKLNATKEVFKEYNVIGIAVDSGVSKQPFSDGETLKGALNRAKGLPKDGLRIGLEAGLSEHFESLFLINWGVLIDQEDNIYYAGGTRIPLPQNIHKLLLNKEKELSNIMDELLGTSNINEKEGAIGYLTNLQVKRKDIFVHINKLLYGQYLKQKRKEEV